MKSSASRYSRQVPQIASAYRQRQFSILRQNSHCLSMEENEADIVFQAFFILSNGTAKYLEYHMPAINFFPIINSLFPRASVKKLISRAHRFHFKHQVKRPSAATLVLRFIAIHKLLIY